MTIRAALATAHLGAGHMKVASEMLDESVKAAETLYPSNSTALLHTRLLYAANKVTDRHYDTASELLAQATAQGREPLAENINYQSLYYQWAASAQAGSGNLTSAMTLHSRSISVLENSEHTDPTVYADALDAYGDTLRLAGDLLRSEAKLLQALAIREDRLPPKTPSLAITLEKLAQTYIAMERYDDADSSLLRAKAIVDSELPPTSQLRASVLRTFAELELARGNAAAAVERARAALNIHESTRDADDGELALSRFMLARALASQDPESIESETLARNALDLLRTRGEGWAPDAERIAAWLESH
ncbi:MAG TPA: tetratricopeptide repeat protein [Nannocystis exedens]|nr:tetratricopeptide repeat protein [Nannocystis exedens]